jgi:hypothetical protein
MPSRQERRKAERDAAKRAPGQAGAAGGAAAARANVNTNPVGDWTTQTEDPNLLFRALGAEIVKQRAGAGDPRSLFSSTYAFCGTGGALRGRLGLLQVVLGGV